MSSSKDIYMQTYFNNDEQNTGLYEYSKTFTCKDIYMQIYFSKITN